MLRPISFESSHFVDLDGKLLLELIFLCKSYRNLKTRIFEEFKNNISQQLSTHSAQKYWREVFFKLAPECGLDELL